MDLLSLLRLRQGRPAFNARAELPQTWRFLPSAQGQLSLDGAEDLKERLEGKAALLFRALHRKSGLGPGKDGATEDLPEPETEIVED